MSAQRLMLEKYIAEIGFWQVVLSEWLNNRRKQKTTQRDL